MSVAEVVNGQTMLTTEEAERLAEDERYIEAGLGSFIEVGRALLDIRDAQLYKVHGSFQAYCSDRWNLTERRVYQLMDGAQVAESCTNVQLPAPPFEGVARELVPVLKDRGPDAVAETWAAALAEAGDEPITARRLYPVVKRMHRDLFKAPKRLTGPAREARDAIRRIRNEGRWLIDHGYLDKLEEVLNELAAYAEEKAA